MTRILKIFVIAAVALSVLALTGCPDRKKISELQANPSKYQNKEVVVAGIVRDSYGVGIPGTRLGGGAYKIDDGTGTMWIIVSDGQVPSRGSQIGVKGRLSSGVTLQGRNYGLAIHEKERKYGKR
jgi:hypothetical protein